MVQFQFYQQGNEDFDIKNYLYIVEEADMFDILTDISLGPKDIQILEFHREFDQKYGAKEEGEDVDHADL